MSTVIPIRAGDPTLDDKIEAMRRAKIAHAAVRARFKAVQDELDAAYDVVAKASRAVGDHIDMMTRAS